MNKEEHVYSDKQFWLDYIECPICKKKVVKLYEEDYDLDPCPHYKFFMAEANFEWVDPEFLKRMEEMGFKTQSLGNEEMEKMGYKGKIYVIDDSDGNGSLQVLHCFIDDLTDTNK